MSASRLSWLLLAGGAAMVPVLWQQNNKLQITQAVYESGDLPEGFDGCRILHISDLHNKAFGPNQRDLLELTRRAEADFLFMTGDLINDGRDIRQGVSYLCQAAKLLPVYYVPGNHEKGSGRYRELAARLTEAGVHVLFNRMVLLKRNGSEAAIAGAADPRFMGFEYLDSEIHAKFENGLFELRRQAGDRYCFLLSHRPEFLSSYAKAGMNLVFAGHAHGGQIRLPGLGGLIAPGQGLFPLYTSGIYRKGKTGMAVSRGLGNSALKQRIGNRPELLVVTLRRSFSGGPGISGEMCGNTNCGVFA